MIHEEFKERMQLSLYGELNQHEQDELEKHLSECGDCSRELERLTGLHAILQQRRGPEPSDQLLQEARSQLRTAIAIERSRRSLWTRLLSSAAELVTVPYRFAAVGVATLAVGFLVGYLVFDQREEIKPVPAQEATATSPLSEGETQITNVRFLNRNVNSGEIEFTFDAVTPMRMRGTIHDEKVQKVLAHALLNAQNPGVRLQSVSAIASQAREERSADPEVKAALISALMYDENPGVRREALGALKKVPFDGEVKRAFLFVLTHDSNTALRIAAINSLDAAKGVMGQVDEEFVNVLTQRMKSDDNDYVRFRARTVLQEVKSK